jgi:hypothetical protein
MLLLLLACSRTEVAESWQIDRMRVLAVAAEPAEPKPGDTVHFTSLIVSPNKPVGCAAYLGCSGDAGACGFGALPDTASQDTAAAAGSGFLGIDPFVPPSWTIPDDYLDTLTEDQKLEGTTSIITVIAISDCDALLKGEVDDPQALLEGGKDDSEIAYKRVPVSLASTPNHNPTLTGITVDGLPVAPGARLSLDPGQTYTIDVTLADDAVETYTYRNESGVDEQRTEQPYFSWYSQEGGFDQTNTLWDTTSVKYTTASSPTLPDQSIWVVARDRRGGMGWAELPIHLR